MKALKKTGLGYDILKPTFGISAASAGNCSKTLSPFPARVSGVLSQPGSAVLLKKRLTFIEKNSIFYYKYTFVPITIFSSGDTL